MKDTKKKSESTFWKENKKGIFITIGIIGGAVLCFFCVKIYIKQPSIDKFLKDSSTSVIKGKRAELHTEYMSYTRNDSYRKELWNMISILDNEIRKRDWAGKVPAGPAYHREHGYNLYKPD